MSICQAYFELEDNELHTFVRYSTQYAFTFIDSVLSNMNDRAIVYIFLCGFALYLLRGGISAYLKDATIFDESEIKIEDLSNPIEWPDLQVCTSPSYKSLDKQEEFLSNSFQDENEFNTLAETAFFTKVDEIITAISIGLPTDYLTILNNSNTIPLQKPYVKSTIIDFDFFGYSASISFSALRQHLIANNDKLSGKKDFTFYTAIWFKVSLFFSAILSM